MAIRSTAELRTSGRRRVRSFTAAVTTTTSVGASRFSTETVSSWASSAASSAAWSSASSAASSAAWSAAWSSMSSGSRVPAPTSGGS